MQSAAKQKGYHKKKKKTFHGKLLCYFSQYFREAVKGRTCEYKQFVINCQGCLKANSARMSGRLTLPMAGTLHSGSENSENCAGHSDRHCGNLVTSSFPNLGALWARGFIKRKQKQEFKINPIGCTDLKRPPVQKLNRSFGPACQMACQSYTAHVRENREEWLFGNPCSTICFVSIWSGWGVLRVSSLASVVCKMGFSALWVRLINIMSIDMT